MTTRLIIDDLKTFTKLGDEDITYARSSREGLSALREAKFYDEVWLDFDLGDDDATEIIKLLECFAHDDFRPCHRVVACSMNPVGRDLIELALSKWYEVILINPPEYL